MAKTHPSYTVNTIFSAKNIATAASVYAFTAAASARVNITVKLTNAAGNGDYIVYLTHDWLGAAAASTVLPKTTCAAASGETNIEFMSMALDVAATDVINVMIDGLAGDTSVNGAIRIVADNPSVFEATDVVSANVTYLKDVALTETGAGYLAAAFKKFFDVATPVLTAASVNQTGDSYPIVSHTDYGNAKLVRSTTPANTLDVAVTGEAGLDFTNRLDTTGILPATAAGAAGGVAIVGSAMTLANDAITAAKIAADAIGASELAATATAEIAAAAWAYATRTLTSTAAATMAAVDGNTLAITARATYSATISGLTISAAWEKIWFTLKSDISDADASSVVQILETNPGAVTDGLLYLNGAAGTALQGSLTIDQAGGTVAIVIADEASANLAPAEGLMYDIKQLVAGVTTVLTSGIANITYTATAAVA